MAAVTVALLVGLAVCIVGLLMRAVKNKQTSSIPGPPGLPFVGHVLQFMTVDQELLFSRLLEIVDGRRLTQLYIMNYPVVITSDPACIGEVVRRKDLLDKSYFPYCFFRAAFKDGIFVLKGAEWKQRRTWLSPGFRKSVLDSFIGDFSAVAKAFLKTVPTGEDVEVRELLADPITRAFMLTSLGDGSEKGEEALAAVDFIEEFFAAIIKRAVNPMLWPHWLFMLTADGRKLDKAKRTFDEFTRRFITRKREALRNRRASDAHLKRRTLLDFMMDTPQHQESMSEEAIQDEVKNFFIAAADTSATVLGWAFKILSLLPEVQERLHAEICDVFGDSERDVSIEDIPKLKYMERFLKEVMRMFPPGAVIGRQCYGQTTLWGHEIPANTTIAINIFSAHRDPRHWSEPGRFDPDRFLPDAARNRHPYAYMPFSAGSRNCIGGTYAMYLMTTLLCSMIRDFSVLPVDDGHVDLQSLSDHLSINVTLRLRGGFRVKFRSRGAGLGPHAQPTASRRHAAWNASS
ncbi:probable cytochrome P450 4ac1 [Thrips palmi]|uniref:Probable cytochrome P450 4ac1 n=1 Tax=Thrips palmi TaxID=161013 RepID=A0A6P8Y8H3_THRPL|nr:probable cytochrome P450 4ac1 [Thrips palmi]